MAHTIGIVITIILMVALTPLLIYTISMTAIVRRRDNLRWRESRARLEREHRQANIHALEVELGITHWNDSHG